MIDNMKQVDTLVRKLLYKKQRHINSSVPTTIRYVPEFTPHNPSGSQSLLLSLLPTTLSTMGRATSGDNGTGYHENTPAHSVGNFNCVLALRRLSDPHGVPPLN